MAPNLDAVENVVKSENAVLCRVTIAAMFGTCVEWKFGEVTNEERSHKS
jgi:hypothetical protein